MLVKRMAFALLGVGMLVGAGAARLRAESYGSAVLSLNPNVYYRLGEPAGAADGSAVDNVGTEDEPYDGTWGSGLAGYPGREAISGQAGPRPTDSIGGFPLLGLEPDNRAAGFTPGDGSGNSDMISINVGGEGGDPVNLDTESQTVSMFFKSSGTTSSWVRMMTTDPDFDNQFLITVDTGSPNNRLVLVNQNSTVADASYETSVPSFFDDQWHHLVAVRDSGDEADMRLYLDGQALPLQSRGGSWSAGYGYRFGARGTSSSAAFQGQMDEIAIWNRALTEQEALGLFTAATVPEPGTLAMAFIAVFGYALLRRGGRASK